MTQILQVITEYCDQYVDDIRLSDLKTTNAPLYARKMYSYLRAAIPLFNLPPEMQYFLLGDESNPKIVYPMFSSAEHTENTKRTSDFTISLGNEYKGYELFSCQIRSVDPLGNIVMTPVNASYNAEAGSVTISASPDNPVEIGTVFDMDFYKDGFFENSLTPEMMSILGMCFSVVWQTRFSTDWLSMVPKVEDRSFYEQNRANKINADSSRLELLRRNLAGEMRRFEQNQYRQNIVPSSKWLSF